MRIGIVLSKSPSYSETFFLSKIKVLMAFGHDVFLFVQHKDPGFTLCPAIEAPKIYKKNRILQFLKTLSVLTGLFLTNPKRLLQFIKIEKPHRPLKQILKNSYTNAHILRAELDWLHFGFATMAIQSESVAEAIDAKMAVSLRGFDVDVYPLKNENCYNLLWQKVDKVHAISKYTLNKGLTLGLSVKTPSTIITPAVDLNRFSPQKQTANEIPHFLTIGRLHWIKGHAYTLEALSKINKMGVAFKYTIIGSGPENEFLKYLIYQLELEPQVYLIGKVKHEDIVNYLSQSDYYIQYSISEGFCNATLEAQANGLLCIVSDGGGLTENVVDGETGWVVPKRNVKALADSISEVLNLPDSEKIQIRNNALKRISDYFNIEDYYKKFDSFYN